MPHHARIQDEQTRRFEIARLIGRPIYFFDTRYLLANVAALAGWTAERLDAAIAPRVERIIGQNDARISVANGFYVAFETRDLAHALSTARSVCLDILTHFYGPREFSAAEQKHFCIQSSVRSLADDLDVAFPEPRTAVYGKSPRTRQESEKDDTAAFPNEMMDLFRQQYESETRPTGYLFFPQWDRRRDQIGSLICAPGPDAVGCQTNRMASSVLSTAASKCQADVEALGVAARGVRHLLERGEIALVSVPVDVETLSWAKTRNAYIEVLSKVPNPYRALLAPRIQGITPGFNLSGVAEWNTAFRRHARWCYLHLPNLDLDFSRVGALGVTGIGITASTTVIDGPNCKIAKLTAICARQNCLAYVDGIEKLHDFEFLKTKGIRLLAGKVLGQPSDLPPTPFW